MAANRGKKAAGVVNGGIFTTEECRKGNARKGWWRKPEHQHPFEGVTSEQF